MAVKACVFLPLRLSMAAFEIKLLLQIYLGVMTEEIQKLILFYSLFACFVCLALWNIVAYVQNICLRFSKLLHILALCIPLFALKKVHISLFLIQKHHESLLFWLLLKTFLSQSLLSAIVCDIVASLFMSQCYILLVPDSTSGKPHSSLCDGPPAAGLPVWRHNPGRY